MNRVPNVVDRVRIRRVLISVSDKSGLELLANGISRLDGLEVLSTGGTFARLSDLISGDGRLRQVSDYTGQPETQGGLVKTLDFKIYLGLLSEPFNTSHDQDRDRLGAGLIDMVVVNLYPFQEVSGRGDTDGEDARSNIDIGGPTMLRAAAKSFLRVAPVCDPVDYESVVSELDGSNGCLSLATRYRLAQKAFAHTASYDTAIASYLADQSYAEAIRPYGINNE